VMCLYQIEESTESTDGSSLQALNETVSQNSKQMAEMSHKVSQLHSRLEETVKGQVDTSIKKEMARMEGKLEKQRIEWSEVMTDHRNSLEPKIFELRELIKKLETSVAGKCNYQDDNDRDLEKQTDEDAADRNGGMSLLHTKLSEMDSAMSLVALLDNAREASKPARRARREMRGPSRSRNYKAVVRNRHPNQSEKITGAHFSCFHSENPSSKDVSHWR